MNSEDTISGVERAIQHLPSETAEDVQEKASYILRHAKPQKQNTSKAERDALRALRSGESTTIFLANEGNAQ
jgi:hypothetical protein